MSADDLMLEQLHARAQHLAEGPRSLPLRVDAATLQTLTGELIERRAAARAVDRPERCPNERERPAS